MSQPFVVSQSKRGNFQYLFGGIAICLVIVLVLVFDIRPLYMQSPVALLLYRGLLLLGLLFFAYCTVFLIKRWRNGKEILRIDDRGITDNSSAIPFGFIPWQHIRGAYLSRMMRNEFIELELSQEEPYLSRLRGLRRQTVLANRRMGHQLVCISLNSTGVSPGDVLPHILKGLEQSRQ